MSLGFGCEDVKRPDPRREKRTPREMRRESFKLQALLQDECVQQAILEMAACLTELAIDTSSNFHLTKERVDVLVDECLEAAAEEIGA